MPVAAVAVCWTGRCRFELDQLELAFFFVFVRFTYRKTLKYLSFEIQTLNDKSNETRYNFRLAAGRAPSSVQLHHISTLVYTLKPNGTHLKSLAIHCELHTGEITRGVKQSAFTRHGHTVGTTVWTGDGSTFTITLRPQSQPHTHLFCFRVYSRK